MPEASHRIKAHGLIGFAAQIALDPLCDLGRQPGFAGGLKKGKVVELVVFVIDHYKPGDPGMIGEPLLHFLTPRTFGLVGADIDERHSPMLRGQQADGVTPP